MVNCFPLDYLVVRHKRSELTEEEEDPELNTHLHVTADGFKQTPVQSN